MSLTGGALHSDYARSGLKRAFDLVIALPLLVLALPIILAAMLIIAGTSSGSPLFSQRRLGRGQTPFACHKLRTMFAGTASVPTHEAAKSSVTPVGRFLRATKIDELPQLWNVLVGEMSLVGPRPCLTSQTDLVERRQRAGVFSIRPGITGHAQVLGVDMSEPARLVALDAEYLRNASLVGDVAILLATVLRRRRNGRSHKG